MPASRVNASQWILSATVLAFLFVWPGIFRYQYVGTSPVVIWRADRLTGKVEWRRVTNAEWRTESRPSPVTNGVPLPSRQ